MDNPSKQVTGKTGKKRRLLVFVIPVILLCLLPSIALCLICLSNIERLLPGKDATQTPEVLQKRFSIDVVPPLDTLEALLETNIPSLDLYDLTRRLEGKSIPESLPPVSSPRRVGEQDVFRVASSGETNASLRYVTEHAYFWVEDDLVYEHAELVKLAQVFETVIYPETRAVFGSEWLPGVDGDPHVYILYTDDEENAGSFTPVDELNPLLNDLSDGHEMIRLSAKYDMNDAYVYATLAHEFQHLIHYNLDSNEELWLEEGLSELAAFLAGYDPGGFDRLYVSAPDIPLTEWPENIESTDVHYGGSFLLAAYLFDRFGGTAIRSLASDETNGLQSLAGVLSRLQANDPVTGKAVSFNDLFLDFSIALYLQDETLADGRYAFHIYPSAPQATETERMYDCPFQDIERQVSQYGIDYIGINCSGDYRLSFQGSTSASLLPTHPHSGEYAFWSNRSAASDMTLTRPFDFTGISGPITLTFWTWYDIEKDYDLVYLEALSDGGVWQNLLADSPAEVYEQGYTGQSGNGPNWIFRSVDLSQLAGKEVQIRFEYVTDETVNAYGFLIDDIAVPEIGYFEDFEAGNGSWEAAGFARVQTTLPQIFQLALITTSNNVNSVERIFLNTGQSAEVAVHIGNGERVVLVITATTPFVQHAAGYRISLRP